MGWVSLNAVTKQEYNKMFTNDKLPMAGIFLTHLIISASVVLCISSNLWSELTNVS